jgi:small subunit ribosomal protein S20
LANIKSSQKKNRQRIKNEARNRSQRAELRTAIKKVRSAIATKDAKKATEALSPALRLIDRAGRKGVLKANSASRTVSRLVRAVSGLGA